MGWPFMLFTTAERRPSFYKSAIASPRLDVGSVHPRQDARSAHYERAFPDAPHTLTRFGRSLDVERNIIGDQERELAITIIIYKCAPRPPLLAIASNPGRNRNFLECSVYPVVVKTVLAIIGHIKIVEAVLS